VEESPTSTATQSGANQTVLRAAWIMIGVGVLVAMSAAIAGGMNPSANVLPIRNLAAVIMLIGLAIVLGAYRVAWLRKRWERSDMTTQANAPRRRNDLLLLWVIVLSLLLGGAFFIVSAITLAGGVVSVYANLLLRTMVLAALVSMLVYGKGYLRTFCMGAIIPAGLHAASLVSLGMLLMSASNWRQMGGFVDLETRLASLVMSGVATIAAGLVAMAVRFLVESLQKSVFRTAEKPILDR